jgi:hypothetical protein
MVKP